ESTKLVELTVMPKPEKVANAPDTKPLPVMVMFWLVAPWPRELGLVDSTVGAALTVNTPVPVLTPASPLVTVTFRRPVVALAPMVILAGRWVESTKVVELTAMFVPEKLDARLAPDTNPVPVMVMFWL